MSCDDPQCYNYNQTSPMYCDKCIKKEIDKMSYDEVSDMYAEGKEWLDGFKFNKKDEQAKEMMEKFRRGWFALLNLVLLDKKEKDPQ